ncbi:MAG: NupC/NupG family nucleoside CNT transporter [Halioglobus sp.]
MNQALLGLPAIIFIAWILSANRAAFPWRIVLTGLAAQLLLATLFLKVTVLQDALLVVNRMVLAVEAATAQGTAMVFGFLGGGEAPFDVTNPQNTFVLAFRALPLVLVFAALSALLWHWRVLPLIISGLAKLLTKSMRLSGAVGMSAAASIFIGMVESPLLIKPYLARMSRAELFMLMTCGMATVAGTVLALYAGILSPLLPSALSHILVASLISAPAALLLAAVIIPPQSSRPEETQALTSNYGSSMEALVQGTSEGVRLLANIVAMLIVFVALVHLIDIMLGLIPGTDEPLTLIGMFGTIFMPLAWLMGIPWQEAGTAGELLASKVFINELVAYLNMAALPPAALSDHSQLIMTYALCGFANFGSLGIMIGGLSALCPQRAQDIVKLAPLSVVSGMLATCMTGCIVGLVV